MELALPRHRRAPAVNEERRVFPEPPLSSQHPVRQARAPHAPRSHGEPSRARPRQRSRPGSRIPQPRRTAHVARPGPGGGGGARPKAPCQVQLTEDGRVPWRPTGRAPDLLRDAPPLPLPLYDRATGAGHSVGVASSMGTHEHGNSVYMRKGRPCWGFRIGSRKFHVRVISSLLVQFLSRYCLFPLCVLFLSVAFDVY